MALNDKGFGQQFVVDILTKYRDEGLRQAQEAQTRLKTVLGASTAAFDKTKQASQDYTKHLNLATIGLEKFNKLSWLGVAAGTIVSKAFIGIANWAEKAAVKVAIFGEELYYMNRRLGQPGTAGLFNLAFAGQQIGLSPEQSLGAMENMGAAIRTNPGLAALLARFLPGYKPSSTVGAQEQLGLVNKFKGQFGEKGYFIAAQLAEEFGIGEREFRQMWTNIEELNAQYKVHSDRLKDFGLNTAQSSKSFAEFSRALNNVIDILDIRVTKMGAWFAENIGTPVANGAAGFMTWKSPLAGKILGYMTGGLMGGAEEAPITTKSANSITNLSANAKEAAIQRFMAMGLSRDAAIGAATGLQGESGQNINPQSSNASSGAYGIANWLGQRKRNFNAMFGHPIEQSRGDEQWQFLSAELQGKGGDPQTAAAFKLLKNPNMSAAQATGIWENMVERHGDNAYTAKLILQAQTYASAHPSGSANNNYDVAHNVTVNIQGNADMGVMRDAASLLGKDSVWEQQMRQAVRGANLR